MQGVTEGRIVHFVLERGRSAGQQRPAIIVNAWSDGGGEKGCVNLQVFLDGSNDAGADRGDDYAKMLWQTSVYYSEEPKPGTWHWIPG